jgi:putative protease
MDLVCPAGNLPALKGAVDHGANAVYMGFRDDTNARSFPGLNFSEGNARDGIRYAHDKGTRVYVAINTYPQPGGFARWQAAVVRRATTRRSASTTKNSACAAWCCRGCCRFPRSRG